MAVVIKLVCRPRISPSHQGGNYRTADATAADGHCHLRKTVIEFIQSEPTSPARTGQPRLGTVLDMNWNATSPQCRGNIVLVVGSLYRCWRREVTWPSNPNCAGCQSGEQRSVIFALAIPSPILSPLLSRLIRFVWRKFLLSSGCMFWRNCPSSPRSEGHMRLPSRTTSKYNWYLPLVGKINMK
jgi:hypothetical protein